MNRRGFLTSLAALASTTLLPSLPSIPVMSSTNFVMKVMMNSMYGKMYTGGRVYYSAPDGIITQNIRSKFPCSLTGAKPWSVRDLAGSTS